MQTPPDRSAPASSSRVPTSGPSDSGELRRLGPYRILKLLGEGGMGAVYHAEDDQLRRPVALKVMRPELARDPNARARFVSEARAAAGLKHEHIVTIYHVGDDGGTPYLAMEFLNGKSLHDWLQADRRATVAETLSLGRQIARGLAAAHAAGLIHRDIKPANIWLEAPRGRVKILDFGLARPVDGRTAELTTTGAVLGTPAYMAPEQARGDTVDFRTDLFSLGCVLYRMLTGRQPFAGKSVFAVLSAVATATPPAISELNPSVPQPLADLVQRLLAKEPQARPASAQAVAEELQAIDRSLRSGDPTVSAGVLTTVATASPREESGRPRRRWLLIGTAAAVAIAAAGVAALNWPDATVHSGGTGNGRSNGAGGESIAAQVQEVDLLDLVDPDRDRISGRWNMRGGVLIGGANEALFHIVLPWTPPQEYRLKFTATRIGRNDKPLHVGLSCGEDRWIVLFDAAQDDIYLSGISGVDGEILARRADARRGRVFSTQRPVRIECTVRPGHCEVTANGLPICLFEGDLSRLDRGPRFRSGATAAPLIIGGRAPGVMNFTEIVLIPLGSDRGQPFDVSN